MEDDCPALSPAAFNQPNQLDERSNKMKLFSSLLFIATTVLFSCNAVDTKSSSPKDTILHTAAAVSVLNQAFTTDWKTLTNDFMTWYNYTYNNVRLSQDFIGLDIDSTKIDKATFLNKLLTENVVAFKTKILQGQSVYQLFQLNSNDKSIRATIEQMASTEIEHFKMEGMDIPAFNFTDLNGNRYSTSSTKGKIVVLKCWFIHCVACVKEFPELNQLVDENKGNNDLLFISLALDAKADLTKFLKTKPFKYVTIPEMQDYMANRLKITTYPTHVLVDRKGKIIKVVNRIEDLVPFLKNETARSIL